MFRIAIYGDPHLSSKNHGSHKNYPEESLHYFEENINKAIELGANAIVSLGDFTFGRFLLDYRIKVEEVLNKVADKHYMLKGNHDEMTDGVSEYEYYLQRGLFKPSQTIQYGKIRLKMFDWGKDISFEDGDYIALVHDYVRYTNSPLPMYGTSYINIDNLSIPDTLQYIVAGHIHGQHIFGRGEFNKPPFVHYPGCNARPSYIHGNMQSEGQLVVLDLYSTENGDSEDKIDYNVIQMPLWSLDESFNLERIEEKDKEKEIKENRVDLSDVVNELNNHDRVMGAPEDIIDSLDTAIEYKEKAKEYLRRAL